MQVNGGVWQERLIMMSILLDAIKLSQGLTADMSGEKWWNTRRVQTNRRIKDLLKKKVDMECIQALGKQDSEMNKGQRRCTQKKLSWDQLAQVKSRQSYISRQ